MATKLVTERRKVDLSEYKEKIWTIILASKQTNLRGICFDIKLLTEEIVNELALDNIDPTEVIKVVQEIFSNLEITVSVRGHNHHLLVVNISPKTK